MSTITYTAYYLLYVSSCYNANNHLRTQPKQQIQAVRLVGHLQSQPNKKRVQAMRRRCWLKGDSSRLTRIEIESNIHPVHVGSMRVAYMCDATHTHIYTNARACANTNTNTHTRVHARLVWARRKHFSIESLIAWTHVRLTRLECSRTGVTQKTR